MSSNSIAKGYSSIAELPIEVKSSFDETDQEKWMEIYNETADGKSDEETVRNAREQAWLQMMDSPSGLAVETWGSVEIKDWDGEVVKIDDLEAHCDEFLAHGGHLQTDHTNCPIGAVWKWERAVHPETGKDGIKFWFNVYGDTETTERAREEILSGEKNSVSIGAEAPRGEYKCDDRGCYVERNVTDFYELSLCATPCCDAANFIAINGENIAKSRHHNKGDIVVKLDKMTVHEDYTTCPIQAMKRNLIKAGITDTHIGKDNHITTKGITRAQLIKVMKETDATCKFRETEPGVYEIKFSKTKMNKSVESTNVLDAFSKADATLWDLKNTVKSSLYDVKAEDYRVDNYLNYFNGEFDKIYENFVGLNDYTEGFFSTYGRLQASMKKSDAAMNEQLEGQIDTIRSYTDETERCINQYEYSSAIGFVDGISKAARELDEMLCNLRESIHKGDYNIVNDESLDAKVAELEEKGISPSDALDKDIDPNKDIQQFIDEAISKGWAYRNNEMVMIQKEVPEAFFKDMYDRGYVQKISGYYCFRNEIIAKLTSNELDVYSLIRSRMNKSNFKAIKQKVLKAGYTQTEFDHVVAAIHKRYEGDYDVGSEFINDCGDVLTVTSRESDGYTRSKVIGSTGHTYDFADSEESFRLGLEENRFVPKTADIHKEGAAGASSGGAIGTSTAGASNTIYGKKPTSIVPKNKVKGKRKEVVKSFRHPVNRPPVLRLDALQRGETLSQRIPSQSRDGELRGC